MYYVPYTLFKNMLYFPHEALLSFMQFLCFMSILGYESIKNKPDSTLKKKCWLAVTDCDFSLHYHFKACCFRGINA